MILSKSYKEIMDKIYVDDAMKQRILQNIEQELKEQRISQNMEQEPKEQRIFQNMEQESKEQRTTQNIEQKPKEQRATQNIEQNKYFIGKNRKKHIFHYKKISVYAAAILLIFCFTSYFGMSTILHTNGVNQHSVASNNKKDSKSANADAKDTESNSANPTTKNIDSESANTRDTDSNQLNSDTIDTEDEANTAAESDTGTLSAEAAYGIDQYSSAKELSQKVGFTISDIPSSLIPFKISEKIYSDCGDGLAEIQYYSDKADNVIYHKQTVANADISGDYTEYSKITTIKIRSTNICLKGENNKYNLATWSKGNYSYSLYFSEAITEKKFQNILKITI